MTEEYGIVDVKKLVQQHDQLRQVCEDLKLQLAGKEDEKAILRQEMEEIRGDRNHWFEKYKALLRGHASTDVCVEVLDERVSQDEQWGGPAHDDTHEPLDWLAYIDKQVRKAKIFAGINDNGVWTKRASDDYRERLIKIAAVAIAAAQSYDRKKGDNDHSGSA